MPADSLFAWSGEGYLSRFGRLLIRTVNGKTEHCRNTCRKTLLDGGKQGILCSTRRIQPVVAYRLIIPGKCVTKTGRLFVKIGRVVWPVLFGGTPKSAKVPIAERMNAPALCSAISSCRFA